MRRKLYLVPLWLVIIVSILIVPLAVGPRLVTDYYIGQLGRPSPAVDAALIRLNSLGKQAVPGLLKAIDDRDPAFIDRRAGKMADDSKFGIDDSLIDLCYARLKNDVECRADLCVYLLVPAWNAGWLKEADQRRMLKYLHYGSVRLDAPNNVYEVGGPAIVIRGNLRNKLLAGGQETLWVQKKIDVVTRDESGEGTVRASGVGSRSLSEDIVEAGKIAPTLTVAQQALNVRAAAWLEAVVQPADLGCGKHELYLRVSLGPTTKSSYNQTEESPWYQEFTHGPLAVEIVP